MKGGVIFIFTNLINIEIWLNFLCSFDLQMSIGNVTVCIIVQIEKNENDLKKKKKNVNQYILTTKFVIVRKLWNFWEKKEWWNDFKTAHKWIVLTFEKQYICQ